jgi:hypothetical protein
MCKPLLDYMKLKKPPPLETTQKKIKNKNILNLKPPPPPAPMKYEGSK